MGGIYYRNSLSYDNLNLKYPTAKMVIKMTKIVADDLQGDEVSALVEYLTALSNVQIAQHKSTVEFTGLSNTKIRFLLKKFLYTRHLAGYGVLETAGNFEIVRLKPEEKRTEQRETLSPTMLPESIGLGGVPRWGNPSDMIEWQGQPPPPKKARFKKQ
jgi:hypothetical protein